MSKLKPIIFWTLFERYGEDFLLAVTSYNEETVRGRLFEGMTIAHATNVRISACWGMFPSETTAYEEFKRFHHMSTVARDLYNGIGREFDDQAAMNRVLHEHVDDLTRKFGRLRLLVMGGDPEKDPPPVKGAAAVVAAPREESRR